MLKKSRDFMVANLKDEYYLSDGTRLFKINEVGARIFSLLNGKMESEKIVGRLSKVFPDVEPEKLMSDYTSFVELLLTNEIVKDV
ncbi:PqqD family protein [Leuconostoc sp. MS02]|uniref:PqqD family protein n=1 Tax=Leuconostoc aquikimchii TaxID=3236804 RepID=A0ABV3S517_9LACO